MTGAARQGETPDATQAQADNTQAASGTEGQAQGDTPDATYKRE